MSTTLLLALVNSTVILLFPKIYTEKDMEDLSLETLQSRHRKELKDVRAKIQQIKKSASSGSKQAKKEAQIEIARLESEVDARHQQELGELAQTDSVKKSDDIDQSAANYTLENLLKNLLERGHFLKVIEIKDIGKPNES